MWQHLGSFSVCYVLFTCLISPFCICTKDPKCCHFFPLSLLETQSVVTIHYSYNFCNFVYFLRYAEDLEIQISLCSAGDVMMLTIVTASNLHTRWGFYSLSLGLHNMLKIVHYMFISGYCRMSVVDPICAPNIQGVIAVDPMFQGTA